MSSCAWRIVLGETVCTLVGGACAMGAFFAMLEPLVPLSWNANDLVTACVLLLLVPLVVASLVAAVSDAVCHRQPGMHTKRSLMYASPHNHLPTASALRQRSCCFRCHRRHHRVLCRCAVTSFAGLGCTVLTLWLLRKFSPQHLDDVHPSLPCPLMERFVRRPQQQFLWVIPMHGGSGISGFPDWCARQRALAAAGEVTLGMHGVHHDTNNEFVELRGANLTALLDRGVDEFRRCFGAEPTHFAPPGQRITTANLGIVRGAGYGMRVRSAIEGLTSRIYHCDDAFCPSPILCSTAWLDVF